MDAPSQATPQDVTVADRSFWHQDEGLLASVGCRLETAVRWFTDVRAKILIVIGGLTLVVVSGMLLDSYGTVNDVNGGPMVRLWMLPLWLCSFVHLLILFIAVAINCTHACPTSPSRHAKSSDSLGPYRLHHRIGSGGMGDVYLAEHTFLERKCAIKLIRPERAGKISRARFEREVRAAARLAHVNIVTIYDGGRTIDGTFYYAMEFLDGMNLDDLVQQHGPLPTARVVYLVAQMCSGLSEAHRLGLIHRDVKPANIFMTVQGGKWDVVKLLDFGLVKPIVDATSLTLNGMVTGSPFYLSPEPATGKRLADQRSDIYSLGAVMYFLLTNRPPFCDEQTLQLLLAHVHRQPTAISEFNNDVSMELEATVLKCLAKHVDDRFSSAADLVEALHACPEWGEWDAVAAAEWWQAKLVNAF
ncbi:MAG TPA: serine/threonine protein kinase [Planctomycetes bacterium]|nr:serine/threonine protein kinase [Planctomycetota bacterium]